MQPSIVFKRLVVVHLAFINMQGVHLGFAKMQSSRIMIISSSLNLPTKKNQKKSQTQVAISKVMGAEQKIWKDDILTKLLTVTRILWAGPFPKVVSRLHSSCNGEALRTTAVYSPPPPPSAPPSPFPPSPSSPYPSILSPPSPQHFPLLPFHDILRSHHTWYLSFFLHGQNFWRIKFTPKNANFSR